MTQEKAILDKLDDVRTCLIRLEAKDEEFRSATWPALNDRVEKIEQKLEESIKHWSKTDTKVEVHAAKSAGFGVAGGGVFAALFELLRRVFSGS